MCTSACVKHLEARPQVEMVCIVEDQRNAECFDLFWSQALDSRLSCDGHECREHRNTIWSSLVSRRDGRRGVAYEAKSSLRRELLSYGIL